MSYLEQLEVFDKTTALENRFYNFDFFYIPNNIRSECDLETGNVCFTSKAVLELNTIDLYLFASIAEHLTLSNVLTHKFKVLDGVSLLQELLAKVRKRSKGRTADIYTDITFSEGEPDDVLDLADVIAGYDGMYLNEGENTLMYTCPVCGASTEAEMNCDVTILTLLAAMETYDDYGMKIHLFCSRCMRNGRICHKNKELCIKHEEPIQDAVQST